MRYFDSHAHYYDTRFEQDEAFLQVYPGGVGQLLETLFSDSVCAIVNVGTNPDTNRAAIRQARCYPTMYTALGIHPTDACMLPDIGEALAHTQRLLSAQDTKCVALGEIGLDYHYPDTNRALQWEVLDAQMRMAQRLCLPVVIHDRDAHADIMTMVARYPDVRGVFHSFSASAQMAHDLIRRGYMISFSGTLTFANARKVAETARTLPHESVLIETDCPYLAPHPLRGSCNHSGNLVYTNRALAALWGMDAQTCAEVTERNACRLFGIQLPPSV